MPAAPCHPEPGASVRHPGNRTAILVGIYLWEKYGQYGIALTEEMLREALEKYEKDLIWEE